MPTSIQADPNFFNDNNVVKSSYIKWGKVGDWIKGTLHEKREVDSRLNPGEKQWVYEIIAKGGVFHEKRNVTAPDGTEKVEYDQTLINEGQVWTVGGKKSIDDKMRQISIGQVVGLMYRENRPSKSKGYADQKVITVHPGEMDPEYGLGRSDGDGGVPVEVMFP